MSARPQPAAAVADPGIPGFFLIEEDPLPTPLFIRGLQASPEALAPPNPPSEVGMQKLYFAADDGTHGQMHHELWVSDGTAAGMAMVKDINAVASNPVRVPSDLAHTLALVTAPPHINLRSPTPLQNGMTVFNGQLFFGADDGTHGNELWVSDGTAAGTAMVKDINAGSSDGTSVRVPSNLAHTLALVTAPPPHQPLLTHSAAVRYDRLQRPAILRGRRWHPWRRAVGERRHCRRHGHGRRYQRWL